MRPPKSLPLAPRPLPGETVLSWVGRIAARYDLSRSDLLASLHGGHAVHVLRVAWLNWGADPELDRRLAAAARLDVGRIRGLRVAASSAPESRRWARTFTAWCLDCVRDDVARHGEAYERLDWRLGCCVACAAHRRLLIQGCAACGFQSCGFRAVRGRQRLVCNECREVTDAWPNPRPREGPAPREPGPLGLLPSPELTRLVAALQADLLAILDGSILTGPWASGFSSARFASTIRELGAAFLKPAWSDA